jgi:hypothetical protein
MNEQKAKGSMKTPTSTSTHDHKAFFTTPKKPARRQLIQHVYSVIAFKYNIA